VNLLQFETAAANELGLDAVNEKTTIDDALNVAVQRVLEDTHCYVTSSNATGWDGTSEDYTLDSRILDIIEVQLASSGVTYPLERLSVVDLLERRRTGSGTPASYYCVSGANLLMFSSPPGSGDTMNIYYIPVPTSLSSSTDDPSSTTYGGVPSILHEAVFFYACSRLASYDDDQSSAQGQRYRDWYKEEITRYKEIIRKRGGTRNARAVVNEKRRPRLSHLNDVYPSS
jgi:hypothetical protein